jgi:hypothetical protein
VCGETQEGNERGRESKREIGKRKERLKHIAYMESDQL